MNGGNLHIEPTHGQTRSKSQRRKPAQTIGAWSNRMIPAFPTVALAESYCLLAFETSLNTYSLVDSGTNRLLASDLHMTRTSGPGPNDTTFKGSYTDPHTGVTLDFVCMIDI